LGLGECFSHDVFVDFCFGLLGVLRLVRIKSPVEVCAREKITMFMRLEAITPHRAWRRGLT